MSHSTFNVKGVNHEDLESDKLKQIVDNDSDTNWTAFDVVPVAPDGNFADQDKITLLMSGEDGDDDRKAVTYLDGEKTETTASTPDQAAEHFYEISGKGPSKDEVS
jgi:hypothetical protein